MKKISVILGIIFVALLVSSYSLFNSVSNIAASATTTPTALPTPTQLPQNSSDVSLLKLEVELLREHNKQLLDTIYWSLGIVFTLTLFVVGAGWYVNFRLSAKDKAEIQQSMETLLKERMEKDKETLQTLAQKYSETASSKLTGQFNSLKNDLQHMRYKMLEEDAKSWRAKGVFSNELRSYLEMLGISKQLDWEWLLSDSLQGMQNALKSGATPDVEDVREITKSIDELDKSFIIEVNRLKELLLASRNKTG